MVNGGGNTLSAVELTDEMLEATRLAYMSRDFALFAPNFRLPQLVGTFDGDTVVRDEAELRAMFERMCAVHEEMGVIDLYRKTLSAEFKDARTVHATFSSRHILKGHVLGEEVVASGLMQRDGNRWQITESRFATRLPAITSALTARAT
ncbi:MAG: hypothetical protein AAGF13_10215 [Pseudomonadota bacterium]